MVTVDEIKGYLRVDYPDDDVLIGEMIKAGDKLCLDILRTDDLEELKKCDNGKIAVMYAAAYLY